MTVCMVCDSLVELAWEPGLLNGLTVCMVCDSLVELTREPGLIYEQLMTAYSIQKQKAWNIYLTSVST